MMMSEKIINGLKNIGHHGYTIQYGDGHYLFDSTDEVIYNLKTGKTLVWQKRNNLGEDFVQLYDGHGGRSRRYYKRDFINKSVLIGEVD